MRVTVINGSPKGQDSVTLRFVEFLQLTVKGSEFTTFDVAKQIRGFESREEKMAELKASVAGADLVLFATPVYYMTVPSQLMRFASLMMQKEHLSGFAGKRVALLTTSIHFFDHTAFDYMRAVFDKAGMLYTYGFSAHMEDLTKKEGQGKLTLFAKKLAEAVHKNHHMPRRFLRHDSAPFRFEPSRDFHSWRTHTRECLSLQTHKERIPICQP